MSDKPEPKLIEADDVKHALAAAEHVELLGWEQRADAIRRLAVAAEVAELLADKGRATAPAPSALAEDWRQAAEEARRIVRLKSLMEDDMIAALEPLWQRARAPGADQVPDDATVTVFMSDCREALRVIGGRAPAADYRDLLKRYMRHVGNEEGTTFLPSPGGRTRGGALSVPFTAEEMHELEAIEDEGAADEAREGAA